MTTKTLKAQGNYMIDQGKLVFGMLITLVGSLSVHVVMLQILHVPFPDFDGVSPWAPFLNTILSVLAVMYFYSFVRPRLARFPLAVRCLIIFALYAMLKESLRGILMNGVVTRDWKFDALAGLPGLLSALVLTSLVVTATPLLRAVWLKVVAAVFIAGLMIFAVRPVLHGLFASVLKAATPLNHADAYAFPYGWQVLVPAYITFAEPVIACTIIAALMWRALPSTSWTRLLSFCLMVLLMRGMLFPTLIYSFYSKLPLPSAVLSESQFLFETIALALLTALTWQLSIRKGSVQ